MTWNITQASPVDAEQVAGLVEALLTEISHVMGMQAFTVDTQLLRQQADQFIGEGRYHVLLARETGAGDAIGVICMIESCALYAQGLFGTIPEFYVVPRYRSRGLGKALLSAAQAYAAQQGWSRLEVTTPPLPAFDRTLAFYQANGFDFAGGRKLKWLCT